MKRNYLYSLLVCFALSNFATIAKAESDPLLTTCYDSVYVGLGLGFNSIKLKNTGGTIFQDTDGLAQANLTGSQEATKSGIIGTLFLGYGATFDYLYAGGELWIDESKGRPTTNDFIVGDFTGPAPAPPPVTTPPTFGTETIRLTNQSSSTFSNFAAGADLRFGLIWSKTSPFSTLFYGKVGLGWTQLRESAFSTSTEIAVTAPAVADPATDNAAAAANKSSIISGWRLGLGIEQHFGCNFSVRGDYTFSTYRCNASRNVLLDLSQTPPDFFQPSSYGRAHINSFILGVVYSFN